MVWYHEKPVSQLSSVMDVDTVLMFLNDTQELRYHVHSLSTDRTSPYVLPSTIKRAIKNGHTDLELWVYINPLYKSVKPDINGNMRDFWEHNGKTQSFVIDYDDLYGIHNIKQFISRHLSKGMPLPYYISQTGPRNYHALYLGRYGEWPQNKILWLFHKWLCADQPISDPVELYNSLLESGIDTNYFNQHYGKHKIRIPGSINKNHRMDDGTYWIVRGWLNPNYNNAEEQYYREIAIPRPNYIPNHNVSSITEKQTVNQKFNSDVFVNQIEALLSDLFDNNLNISIPKIAKTLSKHVGWLINNECKITQTIWAEELDCKQFDVSRLLKKLIEKDILTKVDDFYRKGVVSKTYGAGEALRSAIGWVGSPLSQPSWVRWDDGTSNQRMLYDVRYFISIGLDNEEIIKRLHERQAHRPQKKQRNTKSFMRCIDSVKEWNKNHSGSKEQRVVDFMECWM